jgi:hypothetical protein
LPGACSTPRSRAELPAKIDPVHEAAVVFSPEAAPPDAPPQKSYGQCWSPDIPRIEMATLIHLDEGAGVRGFPPGV